MKYIKDIQQSYTKEGLKNSDPVRSIVGHLPASKSLSSNAEISAFGENAAVEFLIKKGMKLVTRNWRCKIGEIDSIFFDREELVFVEVKSRIDSSNARKYLFDNITFSKQKKLRTLVEIYLVNRYRTKPRPAVRIDVIGVLLTWPKLKVINIEHIIAAV